MDAITWRIKGWHIVGNKGSQEIRHWTMIWFKPTLINDKLNVHLYKSLVKFRLWRFLHTNQYLIKVPKVLKKWMKDSDYKTLVSSIYYSPLSTFLNKQTKYLSNLIFINICHLISTRKLPHFLLWKLLYPVEVSLYLVFGS